MLKKFFIEAEQLFWLGKGDKKRDYVISRFRNKTKIPKVISAIIVDHYFKKHEKYINSIIMRKVHIRK